MKEKEEITPEVLINFFKEKPVFDKTETETSLKFGHPSTKKGLYSITDIYKYFDSKGISSKNIDDVKYKYFAINPDFSEKKKEKGQIYSLNTIDVKNFHPDYKNTHFVYYSFDLTKEEATLLKSEYENESLSLMKPVMERNSQLAKNITMAKFSKKSRKEKALTGKDDVKARGKKI